MIDVDEDQAGAWFDLHNASPYVFADATTHITRGFATIEIALTACISTEQIVEFRLSRLRLKSREGLSLPLVSGPSASKAWHCRLIILLRKLQHWLCDLLVPSHLLELETVDHSASVRLLVRDVLRLFDWLS